MPFRFLVLSALVSLTVVSISVPARAATGSAADVRVADAPAARAQAVSGSAPVLQQPTPMSLPFGTTADQTLHATDADGDSLFFSLGFGPSYVTVTTTGPGGGAATGNVHLAPSPGDVGPATASILVSDGFLQDARTLSITVTGPNAAPVLTQPDPMNSREGQFLNQALHATDSDGNSLSFFKVSGPEYLTVLTEDPGTGTAAGVATISPPAFSAGTTSGTIGVTDGALSDQKTFSITVTPNAAPTLDFISDVFVQAGFVTDRSIFANDQDGDMITFSVVSGPTFVTVTVASQGSGFAVGNLHVAPPPPVSGSFFSTIRVSDGALSAQRSFNVFVSVPNRPPVIADISDMTVTEGAVAEQTITATDPDGDYLNVFVASGPNYVTLFSTQTFPSFVGTVRVAPRASDVGTATVTVQAYDFQTSVTKSFRVTVSAGNFPPPCPAGSFISSSLPTFSDPVSIAVTDLNADENPDLLVAEESNNQVSVFLGLGNGLFASRVGYATGVTPLSVTTADFNGDGRLDVAVVCFNSRAVSVLLGNGDGTLAAARSITVGDGPQVVTTADFNHDGRADLAVGNYYQSSVSILPGLGDGTFAGASNYFVGGGPSSLAIGDWNGDGFSDLAVGLYDPRGLVVLRNNGFGGFVISPPFNTGRTAFDVAVADFDRDGKSDLAATDDRGAVELFLGNGDGTFQPRREFVGGDNPYNLAVGDWNGDGFTDVAITNYNSGSVSLKLGDGHGALAPGTDIQVASYGSYAIASGDLDSDLRDDLAVGVLSSNTLVVLLNRGCAPARDRPPKVKAPSSVAATENTPLSVTLTASDADGNTITSLTADVSGLPVGNNSTFTTNASHTAGTFAWTPTFNDGRALPYDVVFTAANALSGKATTHITVANVNRGPSASAGGPYTAFVNSPITFDGAGSSDPDGDPLTYHWIFGDGGTGMGAAPSHTYHATGLYGVAISVSDGALAGIATTTSTVVAVIQARAFTENRGIKLTAGKPEWCAQVEAIGRAYSNVTVDLSSIVMKSAGTGSVSQIRSLAGKTSVGADRDGNGVEEISACFGKNDLRLLFSDIRGTQPVTITIEGSLFTGGLFRASMDLAVTGSGGGHNAFVSPNPLNPEAVLTFVTGSSGPVRVRLFDLSGRLVRSLLDETSVEAGYHDVRIDGRDGTGARLASGTYFYRIDSTDGRTIGKVSVLK